MEFVTIETITSGNKRCVFTIGTEGLYNINCISGIQIELLDKISRICIMDNYIILKTEDRDFRNGIWPVPFLKDERIENNVLVYDLNGNFLWNIGEVVGDIKMAFDNISCMFKSDAEKEFEEDFSNTSDILLECIAAGFTFIVDVGNKKLVSRVSGRVK